MLRHTNGFKSDTNELTGRLAIFFLCEVSGFHFLSLVFFLSNESLSALKLVYFLKMSRIAAEKLIINIVFGQSNHSVVWFLKMKFRLWFYLRVIPQGTVDNNLRPDRLAGPKALDPNYSIQPTL